MEVRAPNTHSLWEYQMPPEPMSPERALLRVRQLAKEQEAAAAADDPDAVCRAAALLPATMACLSSGQIAAYPGAQADIREARRALESAESYLVGRMAQVSEALKRTASGRRAGSAYRNPAPRHLAGGRELSV